MKYFLSISFLFVSILFCFGQDHSEQLQQIQVDVVYLASNLLQGRETGTKGEELAAAYIIDRFIENGLTKVAPDGSWYQPFEFNFKENPHATTGGEERIGNNIIGYIDNGAANTIVIGAHYDHLGMGMPMASLHTGDPAIHNGADDNASGVSAMLYLAERLAISKAKKNK